MAISEEVFLKVRGLNLPKRFLDKIVIDLRYLSNYIEKEEMVAIILFGSCARGDIKITSDVDLLVISKNMLDRQTRGSIASHLESPSQGVSTDVIFYTLNDFNTSNCLFVTQVKKDGIILWR